VPPIEANDVSLIRGGPFYSAQVVTRLIHPDEWNLGRRLIFAVAIGWLPLILLTTLFQPAAVLTLLRDYKITARMLIAVPVLLLGQTLMESRFQMIVRQVRKDLLSASEMGANLRNRTVDCFAIQSDPQRTIQTMSPQSRSAGRERIRNRTRARQHVLRHCSRGSRRIRYGPVVKRSGLPDSRETQIVSRCEESHGHLHR